MAGQMYSMMRCEGGIVVWIQELWSSPSRQVPRFAWKAEVAGSGDCVSLTSVSGSCAMSNQKLRMCIRHAFSRAQKL